LKDVMNVFRCSNANARRDTVEFEQRREGLRFGVYHVKAMQRALKGLHEAKDAVFRGIDLAMRNFNMQLNFWESEKRAAKDKWAADKATESVDTWTRKKAEYEEENQDELVELGEAGKYIARFELDTIQVEDEVNKMKKTMTILMNEKYSKIILEMLPALQSVLVFFLANEYQPFNRKALIATLQTMESIIPRVTRAVNAIEATRKMRWAEEICGSVSRLTSELAPEKLADDFSSPAYDFGSELAELDVILARIRDSPELGPRQKRKTFKSPGSHLFGGDRMDDPGSEENEMKRYVAEVEKTQLQNYLQHGVWSSDSRLPPPRFPPPYWMNKTKDPKQMEKEEKAPQ